MAGESIGRKSEAGHNRRGREYKGVVRREGAKEEVRKGKEKARYLKDAHLVEEAHPALRIRETADHDEVVFDEGVEKRVAAERRL